MSRRFLPVNLIIGDRQGAAEVIAKWHYKGTMPTAIRLILVWRLNGGLFGERGNPVAALILSDPPARWNEYVLELPPLSGLVSLAAKEANRRGLSDLLVSYADMGHGHHGGIYQAASWNYAGPRDQSQGLIIDGKFTTGRALNHAYGTRSARRLRSRFPMLDIENAEPTRKHLYWKAFRRSGRAKAKRLGLESLPYPKPEERSK